MDFIKKILLSLCIIFTCTAYSISSIKFGVLNFYPPFIFSAQGGQVYGFDIELAQAICQRINAVCTFTRMPLVNLFEALENRKIDAIISAIYVTPERKKIFDFTEPYYKGTISYIGLNNSNIQINSEGLTGKRIGALTASLFYTYLTETYPNIVVIKSYINADGPINDLAKGNLDLVLLDTPTAKYWVQTSKNLFKIIGNPIYLPLDEGYAIVVSKGNKALLDTLNYQLDQMKANGQIDQLIQKYFSL